MIEVDVLNRHRNWHRWWLKFLNYYKSQGVDMDDVNEISRLLKEWRAFEKSQSSTVFYVENEQDRLMFMLRWS